MQMDMPDYFIFIKKELHFLLVPIICLPNYLSFPFSGTIFSMRRDRFSFVLISSFWVGKDQISYSWEADVVSVQKKMLFPFFIN